MKPRFTNQIAIAVIAVVILILFLNPFVTIESGQVGIKKTFGEYSYRELEPGIHLIVPIVQSVQKVDVRVQTINYTTSGTREGKGLVRRKPIQVLDQRGLPIVIELTVQFRLIKDKASETVERWGLDWSEKIINPTVREVVRDVVGSYPAEIIPTKRQEIAVGISDKIKERIKEISEDAVSIVGVQLRNVELPNEIAQKIKEVQVAKQEAAKMVYIEERAKREQQVKIIEAETKKLERIKKAEGASASKIKEAEGIAKANELIQRSITDKMIRWKELDVEMELARSIRDNPNATVFINTPSSNLHMWLKKKE